MSKGSGKVLLMAGKRAKATKASRSKKRRAARKTVPSPGIMQNTVVKFTSNIATRKRPPLIGCLVVLAWKKPPGIIHTQVVLLADEEETRDLLMETASREPGEQDPDEPHLHVGHA